MTLQPHTAIFPNLFDLDLGCFVVKIKVQVEELDPHHHKCYHDPRLEDSAFTQFLEPPLQIVLKSFTCKNKTNDSPKNTPIKQLVQTMHSHFEPIYRDHKHATVEHSLEEKVHQALLL